MELGLAGKKALVFGASSGMGRSIAETFYAELMALVVSSRGGPLLEELKTTRPGVQSVHADFHQPLQARAATREAISLLNGLDVLVVNTGGPATGKFEDLTTEQWLTGFQSLWLSTVDAIQEALPVMKKQGFGRIIVIASTSAKEPIAHLNVSNGIRAGLLGLMKSLSNEVAEFGITVNVILPGFIDTERLQELGLNESELMKQIPARRLGHPKEIAQLATFLASDCSAYITGQAIACDGGRLKGF